MRKRDSGLVALREAGFEFGDPRLELDQLLGGVGEHLARDLELVARDQIELAEGAAEHGLGVLFKVTYRAVGREFRQLGADFVEEAGSAHDCLQEGVKTARSLACGDGRTGIAHPRGRPCTITVRTTPVSCAETLRRSE